MIKSPSAPEKVQPLPDLSVTSIVGTALQLLDLTSKRLRRCSTICLLNWRISSPRPRPLSQAQPVRVRSEVTRKSTKSATFSEPDAPSKLDIIERDSAFRNNGWSINEGVAQRAGGLPGNKPNAVSSAPDPLLRANPFKASKHRASAAHGGSRNRWHLDATVVALANPAAAVNKPKRRGGGSSNVFSSALKADTSGHALLSMI